MDKRVLLAGGLLVVLVLFSGCVKMEVWEDINVEGMSKMTMKIDMGSLIALAEMGGEEMPDPCLEVTESDGMMENMVCDYNDGVLTLSGDVDRTQTEALSIENGVYRFDVRQAWSDIGAAGGEGYELPDPASSEEIEQAREMGIEMTYYVRLPGNITSQEGGEIMDDGFVKFDLMAVPEGAFVESAVPQAWDLTIILGIVIALLVVGILTVTYFKRK